MNKKTKAEFIAAAITAVLFVVLTVLVKCVDVTAAGPAETEIGLSFLNVPVKNAIGYNKIWDEISDILCYCLIGAALGVALIGLVQLIKFKKADFDLWMLGGFYALLIGMYVLFEVLVVNYRPVLIGDKPEASYPSSHTLLALFAAATTIFQLCRRASRRALKTGFSVFLAVVAAIVTIGRLLSGVHWITDIIAAILLSGALTLFYFAFTNFIGDRKKRAAEKQDDSAAI